MIEGLVKKVKKTNLTEQEKNICNQDSMRDSGGPEYIRTPTLNTKSTNNPKVKTIKI